MTTFTTKGYLLGSGGAQSVPVRFVLSDECFLPLYSYTEAPRTATAGIDGLPEVRIDNNFGDFLVGNRSVNVAGETPFSDDLGTWQIGQVTWLRNGTPVTSFVGTVSVNGTLQLVFELGGAALPQFTDAAAVFDFFADPANLVAPARGAVAPDTVISLPATAPTAALRENDLFNGTADSDRLFRDSGILINSGKGDDTVFSHEGNDRVALGSGNDFYDGGVGFDAVDYIFETGPAGVFVDLFTGAARDSRGGNDTLVSVEAAYGSMMDDTLRGGDGVTAMTGQDGRDRFTGRGEDRVDYLGEMGSGSVVVDLRRDYGIDTYGKVDTLIGITDIRGTNRDDIVVGSSLGNELVGADGCDALYGFGGADRLFGENGDDYLFGGGADDNIIGGTGGDSIEGGDGNDGVQGDAGQDRIIGGFGNDTISGGAGADGIMGQAGNDLIEGNRGADTILGGGGDDRLFGVDLSGFGTDTSGDEIHGGGGSDTIVGSNGNDTLGGGTGNDSITGGGGRDTVLGEAGNDTLSGDDGSDLLWGGEGMDILTGGRGADVFLFAAPGSGTDTITDFGGADRIAVEGGSFHLTPGDVVTLVSGTGLPTAFAGLADPLFYHDTATGNLWFDPNGGASGNAVLIADLGSALLTDNDFLIL